MGLIELLILLLIIAWVFGFIALPAIGSLVHVLLVVILILIVLRVVQNRNILP